MSVEGETIVGYELSELEDPMKDDPHVEENSANPEQSRVLESADVDEQPDEDDEMKPMSLLSEPPRRPRSSLPALAIGLVMGVAITIGGMGFAGRGSDPVPDENLSVSDPTSAELPDASQTVTVATVQSSRISRTLETTGTVKAYDLLPILPQAPGLQIQQVLVDEGDYVTAGQVMAILDDSVLRSQVADAQAQVESVRSSKIQTEAGVWQAQAALDQAKSRQTEAEAAISQARAAQSEAEAGRDQAVANLGQAEAELAQAERELERYQELADAGAISTQELEIRRTTVENAREAVRVAEANIRSADARIQSAVANLRSGEARVSSAAATVSSAEARLESAIANVRNAEARRTSAISNISSAQSQVESARANVRSAEANVRSSEARVEQVRTQEEQTVVRAPASGIVAERIARRGDVTSNANKLFSIIANGELELHVKVPETQLPVVKIGASVDVTSDADSRIQLTGTVREISPLLDADSRQATVKVSLPGSDLLRSGMFLRAALTTSTTEGLTVRAKAVLPQSDGSSIVYRLTDNDIVEAQPVTVGQIIDGVGSDLSNASIEIKDGLEVGEPVVVDGAAYLKNGDRVKVVDR